MDEHKEKIAKAAAILEKYDVGKNLTFLIDGAYRHGVDGVEWDPNFKPKDVPGGDRVQRFTYDGKTFELLAVNKRATWDGEEYWSDFALVIDNETVLTTVLQTSIGGEWTTREVSVSSVLLKLVKLGDWMEELQVVCERCRENWKQIEQRLEEERLAKRASNIDLGKYGN
ncbi:hypothetical protein LB533_03505 [Mesorhizobium sp. BR1-1-13]|uniref:hypothetical protein n=1 Tax=Mesorhizobium sp. BR1-1-13 TaxID=2876656 RepID=UPI001CD15BA8|nr:hypothetical protein [Mesorhizobium sp. BR1-1-13]MBZ9940166.1 hypothetical protein [Mesorhizobium sp. BR1-1-13]